MLSWTRSSASKTPALLVAVQKLSRSGDFASAGQCRCHSRSCGTYDASEPFFRLDRDAYVNIIRNWQGQNTEPIFYDLADEHGMMVWNDFGEVTQDSNAEPGDPTSEFIVMTIQGNSAERS